MVEHVMSHEKGRVVIKLLEYGKVFIVVVIAVPEEFLYSKFK